MTKKQRKQIIVKMLGAVLLGIILRASMVPTATLAVERTESKYSKFSAVEQTAAAAGSFAETEQTEKGMETEKTVNVPSKAVSSGEDFATSETASTEKETSNGRASLEEAVESREAGADETADSLDDFDIDTETPGDEADEAADSLDTLDAFDTDAEQDAETPTGKRSYYLPVFETSDTHGLLADTSTEPCQYRLAFISDKVRDIRGWGNAYDKSLAVLLDGGDIYQGNIISSLVKGESLSAVYEAMDYDAVTIGNHDFDWYIESTVDPDATMTDYTLDGQTCVNDVPVVIANLLKNGEKVDFADDYIILEKTAMDKGGEPISVRIAVIGFAENYAASIMKNKFTDEGYSIQEDYELQRPS